MTFLQVFKDILHVFKINTFHDTVISTQYTIYVAVMLL